MQLKYHFTYYTWIGKNELLKKQIMATIVYSALSIHQIHLFSFDFIYFQQSKLTIRN